MKKTCFEQHGIPVEQSRKKQRENAERTSDTKKFG